MSLKNDPRPEAVQTRPPSADATLNDLSRAPFGLSDVFRRAQGNAFGALGLDPSECPYRVIASGSHWRLRDYGADDTSATVLVVAAPIKRPYIWDLAPSDECDPLLPASKAYTCSCSNGCQLRLACGNNGLDEYADAISRVCRKNFRFGVARQTVPDRSFTRGTLAAIYTALAPGSVRGLVLLGAPLCFQPHTSGFRDALVSLVPSDLSGAEPFPGSLLSHMSALASPNYIYLVAANGRCPQRDRPTGAGHSCPGRALGSDEIPLPANWFTRSSTGFIVKTAFVSGELEDRRNARWSFQRVGPHACGREYARRCGPSGLGQALSGCYASRNVAHHRISRRSRRLFAAPWDSRRARGVCPSVAADHLLVAITELIVQARFRGYLRSGIPALGEGQKVTYELQTDRRTGRTSAVKLKLAA